MKKHAKKLLLTAAITVGLTGGALQYASGCHHNNLMRR